MKLYAVASLIKPESELENPQEWSDIWRSLNGVDFSSAGITHFSWHVAKEYDFQKLGANLSKIAWKMARIRITTSGFGVFSGTNPVIYLPVVRTPEIEKVHATLCLTLDKLAVCSVPHYSTVNWIPHITLASHVVQPEMISHICEEISCRQLLFAFQLDHFAVIYKDDIENGVVRIYPFGVQGI